MHVFLWRPNDYCRLYIITLFCKNSDQTRFTLIFLALSVGGDPTSKNVGGIDWPPWIENIGQTELKSAFLLSIPFKNPTGLLKSKLVVYY